MEMSFEAGMPVEFWASELDALTNNLIRWKTIRNMRTPKYRGKKMPPPSDCFFKIGVRVVIRSIPFLAWWKSQFLFQ